MECTTFTVSLPRVPAAWCWASVHIAFALHIANITFYNYKINSSLVTPSFLRYNNCQCAKF